MKELTPFLEEIASKLGTTVEKIWAVLLRQAPISGAIDLIICIVLVLIAIKSLLFVKSKTTKSEKGSAQWEWEEEAAIVAWAGIFIFCFIAGLIILISVENIATAFLNPDYWALKTIMSGFKK